VTSPKPRAWAENGRPPGPADVAERAFRSLLQLAEPDDTERPGLLVTPARAARAWAELTAGYRETVDLTIFDAGGYDEIVVSRLPSYSLCEHYLPPFHGYAHIGTCRARAFSAARSSPGSWTYTRAGSSCRNGSRARLPNALSTSSVPRRRRRRDRRRAPLHDDARRSEARVLHADQRGARHLSREGRGARRTPRAVPSGLTKAGQQDKR
jgi:hypothetical protein